MLYLDANVFVYAAINTLEVGERARLLLGKIQQGEEVAVTSALTFDEVYWAVKKHSAELAYESCMAMLNFPNLGIVAADKELSLAALELIREFHLAPRDAIHVATAIAQNVDGVVTSDKHFGRVKGLKIVEL